MSEAIKPTPGPWYADGQLVLTDAMPKRRWGDKNQYKGPYIVMQTGLYSSPDDATTYANARLVAEAGTVFHETRCTPRQLVELLKEIIAAADAPQAQGGEMWFAESVAPPIDKARVALSKSLPNTVAEVK